ncbi:hypothetical protein [Desulfosporosinus youngiae]|uniref:Uncharacterized protein n=1 Tax=Desulfosporosinus youngiae DSM 17734 TaxID=768710 RepID=H5XW91_9FIRM|nr:hypothetical protein [Desulfosporosinus youngiae]EHQ90684.1 hypothetical protein DesyoDRAFT_3691 [Desulfosporosinus youngiae DSM 17734]
MAENDVAGMPTRELKQAVKESSEYKMSLGPGHSRSYLQNLMGRRFPNKKFTRNHIPGGLFV